MKFDMNLCRTFFHCLLALKLKQLYTNLCRIISPYSSFEIKYIYTQNCSEYFYCLLGLILKKLYKNFFLNLDSGGSPNWVHSARRPLTGLLYLPRVNVRMENLVE
jgi:hypothetical protein